MRTLVGVDTEGSYRASLSLCRRLEFPDQEWIVAHAVDPAAFYAPTLAPMAMPVIRAMDALTAAGQRAVEAAASSLPPGSATPLVVTGGAAASLMRLADDELADLIVVGAGHPRGGLRWVLGSVSRALSYGAKQSVLVTKSAALTEGAAHAVFATDHSRYADAALKRLLKWAPRGLRRIDILTAYDIGAASESLVKDATGVAFDLDSWVQNEALRKGNEVGDKLSAVAPERHVHVVKGHVNEVIASSMKESGADLLILGAQGHGMVERLLVGSVSLHQLVAEPYPVLLIRVAPDEV